MDEIIKIFTKYVAYKIDLEESIWFIRIQSEPKTNWI